MKEALSKFVAKIELGYKCANIQYSYPIENSIPFISSSLGGTVYMDNVRSEASPELIRGRLV
jgi:hypothetical protein